MTRLGVIGQPSDWLIASKVDYIKVKNIFDIELFDIEISELISIYNSKIAAEPDCFINLEHKNSFDLNEINKAYILYLAIKDLVNKYNLKGLTIRCFDLLKTICTTSCLAFALLNDEGIVATCEGDIPSMISMYLVKEKCGCPSFQANPSQIYVESNEILLAHCTVPLKMCSSYNLDTHFESRIGVAINGYLDHKTIYILKINNEFNDFILLKGTIVETPFQQNLCRTQVKIKLDNDYSVNYFLTKPLGNHHIIFYDTNVSILKEFLNTLKGKY